MTSASSQPSFNTSYSFGGEELIASLFASAENQILVPRELTVAEALQDIKVISARIDKQINNTTFVSAHRSDSTVPIDTVCKNAYSAATSIMQLLKRRSTLKAAILQSNAVTKVEIAGKTYTVAEAIAHKDMIRDWHMLYLKVQQDIASANKAMEDFSKERQRKIDNLIERSFGRDSNNKQNVDEIMTITDMYTKKHFITLVDPIKATKFIEETQQFVETFQSQVDFKLSYINAITKITV